VAVKLPDWRLVSGAFNGGSSSAPRPIEEVPIGTKDGSNVTFKTSFTPWLGFLQLFVNGVQQSKFIPRFSLSGNVITLAVAPRSTDTLYCWYFKGPGSPTLTNLRARGFGNVGISSTDSVDYGNNALYNFLSDMSFGAWVQLSSSANKYIVFRGFEQAGNSSPDNESYRLEPVSSGSKWDLKYSHEHGSSVQIALTFAAQLASDKWYYAAFSRDATAKTVTLWIGDGTTVNLIGTQSYSANPDDGSASRCHLVIGNSVQDGSFGNRSLNGAVEEHYIWSRTTTLSEQALAMAGNPPKTSLVLACAMGNNPEIDTSGNGGSGVVTGTVIVQGH